MRSIAVSVALGFCAISLGQIVGRESVTLPTISPAKATLNEAMGWTYTSQKQWVSADRKLEFAEATFRSTTGEWSLGLDNFIKLELRTIVLDGKEYPLLVRYIKSGSYRYPAIHEDWSTWTRIQWYVLETTDGVYRADAEVNKSYFVSLPIIYWSDMTFATFKKEDEIVADIGKTLLASKKRDKGWYFQVGVFPVFHEGKNSTRFLLKVTSPERWGSTLSLFEDIDMKPEAFNVHYYETERNKFDTFWKTFAKN